MEKKFRRSKSDSCLGGVIGGLGKYLGIDTWILRLIAILLIFKFDLFLIYGILWFIVPEEDESKTIESFKDDYYSQEVEGDIAEDVISEEELWDTENNLWDNEEMSPFDKEDSNEPNQE